MSHMTAEKHSAQRTVAVCHFDSNCCSNSWTRPWSYSTHPPCHCPWCLLAHAYHAQTACTTPPVAGAANEPRPVLRQHLPLPLPQHPRQHLRWLRSAVVEQPQAATHIRTAACLVARTLVCLTTARQTGCETALPASAPRYRKSPSCEGRMTAE